MPERRIGGVDLETGELMDGIFVWIGKRQKSPYGRHWLTINQHFLEEFAARNDVSGETLRVFLYLNARLDFDNLIQVPQTEIAEALKLQRPNVNRAMRWLEREGVILRGPKVGHSSTYRLNPMAGWKGKVRNLHDAQTRHLKLVNDRSERTEDL